MFAQRETGNGDCLEEELGSVENMRIPSGDYIEVRTPIQTARKGEERY